MKTVAGVLLVVLATSCGSGGSGEPGKSMQGMCRFATPPLTNGAQARQMAADIQLALPVGAMHDPRNLAISKAVLQLMTAAGSAIPTAPEDQGPDPALVQAVQAQASLAAACA